MRLETCPLIELTIRKLRDEIQDTLGVSLETKKRWFRTLVDACQDEMNDAWLAPRPVRARMRGLSLQKFEKVPF